MKRIDRYISIQFLKYFFATLTGFITMLIVLDISGKVGKLTKDGNFLVNFVKHYAAELPFVLNLLIPIISLMAVLFTVIGLKRKNELTCLLASGISIHRVLLPMICILLITIPFMFLNTEIVIPYFSRQKHDPADSALLASVITEKNVSISSANRLITENGRVGAENFSLTVIDRNSGKLGIFLFTPYAVWSNADSTWDFQSAGTVIQTEEGTDISPDSLTARLQEYDSVLLPTPARLAIASRTPSTLSIHELMYIMPSRHAVMEIFHRFTFPLILFFLIFLSIPYSVGLDKKTSVFIGVGICLGTVFIVYSIIFSALSLGGKGIIPAWSAGLAPLIILPIPTYLIYRKIRT